MTVFQEYEYDLPLEYDILFKKFYIESTRIENQLMMEYDIEELENMIFSENENVIILHEVNEKTENRFVKFISALVESIIRLITDAIDMFKDIFSKKKHINIDSYLDSETGSKQLEEDLDRIHDEVKTEIRKGRKIIQAISKKTKVDDKVIDDYVNKATIGIRKHGKTTINTIGSYRLFNKATGQLNELKNEMKESLSDCKKASNIKERQTQCKKVYIAMKHWIVEYTKFYTLLGNNINQEIIKNRNKKRIKEDKNNVYL